jgi:hypothetical protein
VTFLKTSLDSHSEVRQKNYFQATGAFFVTPKHCNSFP